MNNRKHTSEPWRIGTNGSGKRKIFANIDGDEWIIAEANVYLPYAGKEDAKRIAICVNACAGVDNETLLKIASGEMDGSEIVELAKLKDKYAEIEKQRDELLSAFKQIANHTFDFSYAQAAAFGMQEIAEQQLAKAGAL